MKQHTVPQNIMSVEFKIIGDLTIRQFLYVSVAGGLSFLIFISFLPLLIRIPLIIICILGGILVTFAKINERPFDQWITSFITAILLPTERVWHKDTELPQYIQDSVTVQQSQGAKKDQGEEGYNKVVSYLHSRKLPTDDMYKSNTKMDIEEIHMLTNIDKMLNQPTAPKPEGQGASNNSFVTINDLLHPSAPQANAADGGKTKPSYLTIDDILGGSSQASDPAAAGSTTTGSADDTGDNANSTVVLPEKEAPPVQEAVPENRTEVPKIVSPAEDLAEELSPAGNTVATMNSLLDENNQNPVTLPFTSLDDVIYSGSAPAQAQPPVAGTVIVPGVTFSPQQATDDTNSAVDEPEQKEQLVVPTHDIVPAAFVDKGSRIEPSTLDQGQTDGKFTVLDNIPSTDTISGENTLSVSPDALPVQSIHDQDVHVLPTGEDTIDDAVSNIQAAFADMGIPITPVQNTQTVPQDTAMNGQPTQSPAAQSDDLSTLDSQKDEEKSTAGERDEPPHAHIDVNPVRDGDEKEESSLSGDNISVTNDIPAQLHTIPGISQDELPSESGTLTGDVVLKEKSTDDLKLNSLDELESELKAMSMPFTPPVEAETAVPDTVSKEVHTESQKTVDTIQPAEPELQPLIPDDDRTGENSSVHDDMPILDNISPSAPVFPPMAPQREESENASLVQNDAEYEKLQQENRKLKEQLEMLQNSSLPPVMQPGGSQQSNKMLFGHMPDFVNNPNIISGVVVDSQEKLLEDVVVIIKDRSQRIMRAMKTNMLGQFYSRNPLINGLYDIEANKEGYIFDPVTVELKGQILQQCMIKPKHFENNLNTGMNFNLSE